MKNQAILVTDGDSPQAQLQLDLTTLIQDEKRRRVFLYTALKAVTDLEKDIATTDADSIDKMYAAIEQMEEEEQPPVHGTNGHGEVKAAAEPSLIVLP